jgi:hypothetical protein
LFSLYYLIFSSDIKKALWNPAELVTYHFEAENEENRDGFESVLFGILDIAQS